MIIIEEDGPDPIDILSLFHFEYLLWIITSFFNTGIYFL